MTGEGPKLEVVLDEFKREVTALRMGAEVPGPYASPEAMHEALLDVRQRLDRVESLLGDAMLLRSAAYRTHTAARILADDAWDQAAVHLRASGVRDEYSSARERTAAANLEVIGERRTERITGVAARLCDDAVEYIKLRHRGLSDVRMDVLARFRHQQFETTLDR